MAIKYPEYGNCTANLACSILNYFGIVPPNKTLKLADSALNKKRYKNIVVLVLDGLGISSLNYHLKGEGFFFNHLSGQYSSTFPPTTVASTTALQTGLYPVQSGWLGWMSYFAQIDKNVVYFTNREYMSDEPCEVNVAKEFVPYESVQQKVKKAGFKGYSVMRYTDDVKCETFDEILDNIVRLCKEDERKYIYAYWGEPDHTMHLEGVLGTNITDIILELEKKCKEAFLELNDTLIFITADHGHIDVNNKFLPDYPSIWECLERLPTLEARAVNFFVKPEKEEQFLREFEKHFGEHFILFTRQEVIDKKLFGEGTAHRLFDSMLGNFVAAGITDWSFTYKPEEFKGNHAGLTKEEMEIPLIVIEN